ncbi:hypothetical protein R5R35_010205 [Gryllus longicercus]|uniref:Fibronectin type III domain-containing protein n=1 Tax=Gryllus longicercus TaxID=2509291 RepID=A0AAN9ZEX9_9ORTH
MYRAEVLAGLRWTPGGGAGGDASSAAAASLAAAAAATAAATAEPSAAAAAAAGAGAADGGGVEIDPTGPGASPATPPDPEEALIVALVLVLWVAAIALFFNRWGKIRMLEPYQPKYEAPHRGSCPLVDCAGAPALQHRSFSKFNLTACGAGGRDAGLCSSMPSPHNLLRPRQNSVFVGSSATMVTLPLNPPRKAKSAMDIQTLVLAECGPLPGGADGSFDADGHVPDHLPDSNFSAAIAKIDTFKVTNV